MTHNGSFVDINPPTAGGGVNGDVVVRSMGSEKETGRKPHGCIVFLLI